MLYGLSSEKIFDKSNNMYEDGSFVASKKASFTKLILSGHSWDAKIDICFLSRGFFITTKIWTFGEIVLKYLLFP